MGDGVQCMLQSLGRSGACVLHLRRCGVVCEGSDGLNAEERRHTRML